MGKIIRINGSEEEFSPVNGKKFSLEELQSVVNGYIQFLYLPSGQIMVLDEEGKLKGKPKNGRATPMGRACGIAHDDFIVGDVLICEPTELE